MISFLNQAKLSKSIKLSGSLGLFKGKILEVLDESTFIKGLIDSGEVSDGKTKIKKIYR